LVGKRTCHSSKLRKASHKNLWNADNADVHDKHDYLIERVMVLSPAFAGEEIIVYFGFNTNRKIRVNLINLCHQRSIYINSNKILD
jgi:hypothetical protein